MHFRKQVATYLYELSSFDRAHLIAREISRSRTATSPEALAEQALAATPASFAQVVIILVVAHIFSPYR